MVTSAVMRPKELTVRGLVLGALSAPGDLTR
jgi:hypothetical protein